MHILVMIPQYQSIEAIAGHLGLSQQYTREILDFLTECNLIVRSDSKYKIGAARIHLGNESPYINQHHINWRLRAMSALEKKPTRNVHYSSVLSLAEDDIEQIRTLFLDMLEKSEKILKNSKDEVLCGFNFDLFRI